MYFQAFPQTYYSLDNRASIQVVRNFLLRTVISDKVKNNYSVYDLYDVRDGETPEILAFQLYGDSNLHWIILQMNEIHDPRFEWPLDTYNLKRFVEGKYSDVDGIHHYEDSSGNIVNGILQLQSPGASFVSIGVEVGSVLQNLSQPGIAYVTELQSVSSALIKVTNGGFKTNNIIKKVGNVEQLSLPISVTVLGGIPVTNFVYEDRLNETRRRIKILKPRYVEQIVKDFENKLAQVNV